MQGLCGDLPRAMHLCCSLSINQYWFYGSAKGKTNHLTIILWYHHCRPFFKIELRALLIAVQHLSKHCKQTEHTKVFKPARHEGQLLSLQQMEDLLTIFQPACRTTAANAYLLLHTHCHNCISERAIRAFTVSARKLCKLNLGGPNAPPCIMVICNMICSSFLQHCFSIG